MGRPVKNAYPVSMIVKNDRHRKQYETRIYLDYREYKSVGYMETEKEANVVADGLIVPEDKSATLRNIEKYREQKERDRHKDREEKSSVRKAIGDLVKSIYEVDRATICSISVNVMAHDGKEYKLHRKSVRLMK